MLYTRKGDNGTSGLFGTTERLPKNSPVYEALGTLDELNSLLGFCRAQAAMLKHADIKIADVILREQQCLFVLQAEVAGSKNSLSQANIDELEKTIEGVESYIKNPHAFVVPGATALSGLLDYARSVSRRAERVIVDVSAKRSLSIYSVAYMNRLSSLLYVLARYAAFSEEAKELSPSY